MSFFITFPVTKAYGDHYVEVDTDDRFTARYAAADHFDYHKEVIDDRDYVENTLGKSYLFTIVPGRKHDIGWHIRFD